MRKAKPEVVVKIRLPEPKSLGNSTNMRDGSDNSVFMLSKEDKQVRCSFEKIGTLRSGRD